LRARLAVEGSLRGLHVVVERSLRDLHVV